MTVWPTASAITYGQTLATSTLSGGCSTPVGTFAFTTPSTAPNAGTASQSVTFTPTDTTNYNTATGTVSVTVNKANSSVTVWPTASAITYGQTLASSSLSGGSSTPAGTFAFTTPSTTPGVGTASQGVTFTPTDTTNYNTATGTVSVTVNKANSSVTVWPTASAITYGQTLANSSLSGGSATPAGTFAFTTPSTTPGVGTASQGVTFTPTDTTNYNTATGTVSVTVNKANSSVTVWPTASAITYGQTLANSSLSGGSATPAGTFAFTTPSTTPGVGTASQGVTFTPTDTTNYNTATGTVSVTVNKATTTMTWSNPADITYGTALSGTQLNATASVPGTFTYTPPSGTVLTAGSGQTLSVDFTPTDTSNYNSSSKSVTINVIETTGPNLSVSTLPDKSWTSNATLNISGTASDAGSGLQGVTVNGGAVTVNPDGTFSTLVILSAGANTITVVATNNASLTTTDTRTIYYDGMAPDITITGPSDSSITKVSAATLSGTVDANSHVTGVTLNGNPVSFSFDPGTGTFTAGITLVEGMNTIVVSAADLAGNTSSAGRTVTLDNINPTLAVTEPNQDISTNQGSVAIQGTVSDATITTVTMSVNGGAPQTLTVTGGAFNTTVTFTTEGPYAVVVTATDAANNSSIVTRNIIYDATSPTLSPVHISSNNADPTKAVAGDIVTVTFTSSEVITTPTVTIAGTVETVTGGPTNWSATHTVLAEDAIGTVAFSISSFSDAVGNAGSMVSSTTDGSSVTKIKADSSVSEWPTASAITYGQTLASSILTGGSSTPAGTFAFTTPSTAPGVGTASQGVTFTPTDTTNYNTATGTVSVTVNKANSSITTWPTATAITYGQTLASSSLSGGSSTPAGTFAFTTPSTAPGVGTASQGVTFTPTDTTNYNTATGTVSVTVNKANATITWPTASAITYGQTLASSILTGGSSTPVGTFAFTTPSTAPGVGTASQSVTFTPTDTTNYNTATGTVSVTVNKATPTITWSTPADIAYGTALSGTQLNATASVPGTFTYTPSSGTVLTAGSGQILSAAFIPTDTSNYNSSSKTVTINVIDTTGPVLLVSTLDDGSWTSNAHST